jgi:hypothetical protein
MWSNLLHVKDFSSLVCLGICSTIFAGYLQQSLTHFQQTLHIGKAETRCVIGPMSPRLLDSRPKPLSTRIFVLTSTKQIVQPCSQFNVRYLSRTQYFAKIFVIGLLKRLSSSDFPSELRLLIYEFVFPETVRSGTGSPRYVGISDKESCKHRYFDHKMMVWRPISFSCRCWPCQKRRHSRVRNYVRCVMHRSPTMRRELATLYKKKVRFFYHAEQDYPYGTAKTLDDFMKSFGSIPTSADVRGICHLIVKMDWKCKFAQDIPDGARRFRHGQTLSSDLTFEDSDAIQDLRYDTFKVFRILCLLRYYRAKLALTFTEVSSSRLNFLEQAYTMRKETVSQRAHRRSPSKWWNQNHSGAERWDRTVTGILDDDGLRHQFIEGTVYCCPCMTETKCY